VRIVADGCKGSCGRVLRGFVRGIRGVGGVTGGAATPSRSLGGGLRRQRDGFDLGEVELARGIVDVEADDVPLGVEVDDKAFDDLTRLRARRALQLDIEATPAERPL
jgi:hypothetical protein